MVKAFSESERARVKAKLKQEAVNCLKQFGVRKTSVEDLVKLSGISKGSFYNFYPSKELLFFDVVMEYHDTIQQTIIKQITALPQAPSSDDFAELLYFAYKQIGDSFLLQMTANGDMEHLMRNLPDEVVAKHHHDDDAALKLVLSVIPFASKEQIPAFSAGLRAIFLTLLHKREIGIELYDEVLLNLLKGFCKQYISTK